MFLNFILIILVDICVTVVLTGPALLVCFVGDFSLTDEVAQYGGMDILGKDNSDALLRLAFIISFILVMKIYIDQAVLDIPEFRLDTILQKVGPAVGLELSKVPVSISLLSCLSEVFTFILLPRTSYSLVFFYVSVISRVVTSMSLVIAI